MSNFLSTRNDPISPSVFENPDGGFWGTIDAPGIPGGIDVFIPPPTGVCPDGTAWDKETQSCIPLFRAEAKGFTQTSNSAALILLFIALLFLIKDKL